MATWGSEKTTSTGGNVSMVLKAGYDGVSHSGNTVSATIYGAMKMATSTWTSNQMAIWIEAGGTKHVVKNSGSHSSSGTWYEASQGCSWNVGTTGSGSKTVSVGFGWNAWDATQGNTASVSFSYSAVSYSYNMNILNPDGSEPWTTGEAGSVWMDGYGRIIDQPYSSYTAGSTITYRDFTPGTGRYLSSVSGMSPNNTTGPWTVTINGNTTATFQTSWQTYTISYAPNGGSSTPGSQTKTYGQALTLRGAISRNNSTGNGYTTSFSGNGGTYSGNSITATDTYSYTFAGWKSSASGTTYGASGTFNENNTATMTAQWNSSTARGSITLPAASTVSRPYYTFGGWNTNSSGTGTNYNAGASYTPSANGTLYAKWTLNAPVSASVTASYISRTKIDVQASAEAAEITNYTVYYRVNGSGASYSSLSLGTGTSGTITGLQPNTTYQIYVKATNAMGSIDSGTITAKTIPNIPTVSAPTVTTPHPFTPTLQIPASGDTNASITNYTLYWCANPNINTYDMPLKVTSDGALWARIFYQQCNEGTTYFSTLEECRNTQTANKYSRMYLLEDNTYKINGKFEFILCYPNNDSTHYNRWKQTNAPQNEYVARVSTGSQVAGYEAVHIDWTSNYWGGLERTAEDPTTLGSCWLDGSVGHGNWYYPLGTTVLYNHGMPATNDLIENTWSCVELWVRVGTVTASSQSFGSSSSGQAVNLSEETEYLFWGQATNAGGVTTGPGLIYTTPADQAKIYRHNNGVWERGKAYYKVNGEWVKAKKIYIKVNGEWKINSNGGS